MIKLQKTAYALLLCCVLTACAAPQAPATEATETVLAGDTEGTDETGSAAMDEAEEAIATTDERDTLDNEEPITMTNYDFTSFSNISFSGVKWNELDEAQAEALYQYARYWQALTEPDMDTLDEMIPDDMTFTHMSGKTQSKSEYLEDVESGRLNYQKVGIENPKITVDGNVACINCTTVLTANAYGARGSWPFSGERWFQKTDGVWQAANHPNR